MLHICVLSLFKNRPLKIVFGFIKVKPFFVVADTFFTFPPANQIRISCEGINVKNGGFLYGEKKKKLFTDGLQCTVSIAVKATTVEVSFSRFYCASNVFQFVREILKLSWGSTLILTLSDGMMHA